MKLQLSRIIIFTSNMKGLTAFYGNQLGLPARVDPKIDPADWIEFDAGKIRIALHKAGSHGANPQENQNGPSQKIRQPDPVRRLRSGRQPDSHFEPEIDTHNTF